MNIFRTKNVSLDKTEMHRHLKLWGFDFAGYRSHGRDRRLLQLQVLQLQHLLVQP